MNLKSDTSELQANKPSGSAEHSQETLDLKELLNVLSLVKNGNLNTRMAVTQGGINGRICEVLNDLTDMNQRLLGEISSAENIIGKKGNLSKRIALPEAKGEWAQGVNSLNNLITDLTSPALEIAGMINSVANGDLAKQIPLEINGQPLKGEFLRMAKESNQMLSKLRLFSMEVTRVARQVGSEGKLGEQAKIKGVAGVWAELTDSVNQMAGNLTAQVQGGTVTVTSLSIENMVEVCIQDTGIGMSQEIQQTLFTNFSPASATGTNNEAGSGLGLLLVRDFVAHHGGSIQIDSEVGNGTMFKFTVPADDLPELVLSNEI
jgi:methyl-accepting chemotaxis protein